MRTFFLGISRGLSLLVVLLPWVIGCATTDKPLEARRLESIASLEVARYAIPEFQRHSSETMVGGGLLLGGFGMEAAAAAAGERLRQRCRLEDFGKLVVQEFVAQAPKQIPKWPSMRVLEAPVQAEYAAKDAVLLLLEPGKVLLFSGAGGLMTYATATLVAPGGEVIWSFRTTYSQKEAKRERGLEELEADSCKLLKEEMRHAAGVMAGNFIADLKR